MREIDMEGREDAAISVGVSASPKVLPVILERLETLLDVDYTANISMIKKGLWLLKIKGKGKDLNKILKAINKV